MRKAILLLIIVLNLPGCADRQNIQKVEYEGLHENKIRVLVQVRTTMQDPVCEEAACREGIISSARERSIILLRSMLLQGGPDEVKIANTIQVGSIYAPRIVRISCGELVCNALVDFTINEDLERGLYRKDDTSNERKDTTEKQDEQ